jgi:hypothetical protein
MPNRLIKESICTSNEIDQLSPEEEITFYRLIVNCDDFGRADGRPAVLRAKLYPLRLDSISDTQIEELVNKLCSINLVSIYIVDGRPYIQVTKWADHQQIRAQKSKYPNPNNGSKPSLLVDNGYQLISSEINGNHVKSFAPVLDIESDSVIDITISNPETFEIFEFWNKQDIIKHRNFTQDIQKAINGRLKSGFVKDELLKAIENYALILKSDDYKWSYSWTLKDFLQRGLEKFIDMEVAKKNYLIKPDKPVKNNSTPPLKRLN